MNKIINQETSITENLKKLAGNAERHTKKLHHLVGDPVELHQNRKGSANTQ